MTATPLSVLEVARFFLHNQDEEDELTHLKLQKLCYYAQGMHLAIFGSPLFGDRLLAWKHGPVARVLWNQYRYQREALRPVSGEQPPRLEPSVEAFLRRVYEEHGQYSAWKLREMTHAEDPWTRAKGGTIDIEAMRHFFERQLEHSASSRSRLSKAAVRDFMRAPQVQAALAQGRADFASGDYSRL
jgi:uncharacterized phage-associated protein